MAKKIRQIKLTEESIIKNSTKDISHSIAREKKQERIYTLILVLVFMVTIPLTIFLSFRVNSNRWFNSEFDKDSSISLSGEYIALNNESILSDEEALSKNPYIIKYKNLTNSNINFIIRFAKDEKAIESCDCFNKLIDYYNIKYSIDGKTVHSFNDETMLITADMIRSRKSGQFKIWLWINESANTEDVVFLGKVVLEELEDMDV